MKVKGRFKADLCFNGGTTEERFYVVEADGKYILEGEAAKKIGILKIFTNKAEDEQFPFIKGVEVSVTLKPDAKPCIQPPRKLPLISEKTVKKEMKALLRRRIIEPVEGYTRFKSPIVVDPCVCQAKRS